MKKVLLLWLVLCAEASVNTNNIAMITLRLSVDRNNTNMTEISNNFQAI